MAVIGAAEAAHLLRRAAFGGTSAEIDALIGKERDAAVNSLIDYESVGNQELDTILTRSFPFLGFSSAAQINDENFNETELRAWWITRALFSKRPFEEKMTLFWHNHFATSLDTVPAAHMYTQNLDLRRHALGKFDDLLLEVARGAAMLIWLNGVESTKDTPNENFARELQELFTMGPEDVITGEPNYSEDDVKEISRAFAGWRFRAKDGAAFASEPFVDSNVADAGPKTIYGQTANFSGEDVIATLANKRATARFLVYKLLNFFVYPIDLANAADRQTIDRFADVYLRQNHSIKELVRAIFQSDEFFSQRAYRSLVKNPVEFVIGSLRSFHFVYTPGTLDDREVVLQSSMSNMGMSLFRPPNVAGWKNNLGFVNTDTLLNRYNFGDTWMFGFGTKLPPTLEEITRYVKPTTKKVIKKLVATMGIELEPAVFSQLQQFMLLDRFGHSAPWPPVNTGPMNFNASFKVRGLIHLMMCLPEYQLN